ncbi:MAG: helix-turn-helix transcriptional regulator [Bacilli bacterium]|nr:helix-turn-helix transcriptional regulator [Bacilli bacterium]
MKINFSVNLETIIKSKKISQEELAELIGVSRQTIYKWETDICLTNLNKIEKLLEVLKVSINELLY